MPVEVEYDDGTVVTAPKRVRWKSGWEKVRRGKVPKEKAERKKYFEGTNWGRQDVP